MNSLGCLLQGNIIILERFISEIVMLWAFDGSDVIRDFYGSAMFSLPLPIISFFTQKMRALITLIVSHRSSMKTSMLLVTENTRLKGKRTATGNEEYRRKLPHS